MTLDERLSDEPGPWTVVRVRAGEEPESLARLAAEADYTLVVAPEFEGILFEMRENRGESARAITWKPLVRRRDRWQ